MQRYLRWDAFHEGLDLADNTHARIFTAETPLSALAEIEDLVHEEGRLHDRELTTDLPGKIKSADGGGHAFEQPTDPKKHEADGFANRIAKHLAAAHNANKFQQLLIIAEPTSLGVIRKHLPEHVRRLVCFELDKNIADKNAAEIRKHLPTYLPSQ